ncbi:MazG nucleotide pyrophosphohydrolase domain-containing protein [Corynebacterium sp. 335C]
MSIIHLDPRFPTAIPLGAAGLLTGDVSYTEEVPIRVRWAIADAGGHSVSRAEVLITTDLDNDDVVDRLDAGEELISVGLADAPDPAPEEPADTPAEAEPAAGASADTFAAVAPGADGTAPAAAAERDDATPAAAAPAAGGALPELEEAVELMARARRRGEWEAKQTHRSLLPYLLEETFEFADAVEDGGDVLGELADLLLQVLFHAEIAEGFDIGDVARAFTDKLRARSPYLFEPEDSRSWPVPADEQDAAWNAGRTAPRSAPARSLPALALAQEVIGRARAAGVPDSQIPADLMCPTPGLELGDSCEARTRAVAREFLAQLEEAQRLAAGDVADGADYDDYGDAADAADLADDDAGFARPAGDGADVGVRPGDADDAHGFALDEPFDDDRR